MITSDSYSDFLIYPNESIDKLVANRVLYRLFKAISSASEYVESNMTITKATTSDYGIVKRSDLSSYQYFVDDKDSYYNKTMNIEQVLDYARGEYISQHMYDVATLSADSTEDRQRCMCMSIGECSFLHMPNGVKMLIFSFDVGINSIFDIFSSDVASGSFDVPITVKGYNEIIPFDDQTKRAVDDVYESDSTSQPITSMFGSIHSNQLSSTYVTDMKATIHQHECNWLRYSSFKQSCVELTYSASFNVRDLYEKYYSYVNRTNRGSTASENTVNSYSVYEFNRSYEAFQSNPIIIPQIIFYNTNSATKLYTGTYDDELKKGGSFHSRDAVGQNPLSHLSETVTYDRKENEIPSMNGEIIMKPMKNSFRKNGYRRDNTISFDAVFKFTAGNAEDPLKERSIKNMNAKANIQIMMIGV